MGGICCSTDFFIHSAFNKCLSKDDGPDCSTSSPLWLTAVCSCVQSPLFSGPAPVCLLHRLPARSCVLCCIPPFLCKIKAPQQGFFSEVGCLVPVCFRPAGANPPTLARFLSPLCEWGALPLGCLCSLSGGHVTQVCLATPEVLPDPHSSYVYNPSIMLSSRLSTLSFHYVDLFCTHHVYFLSWERDPSSAALPELSNIFSPLKVFPDPNRGSKDRGSRMLYRL